MTETVSSVYTSREFGNIWRMIVLSYRLKNKLFHNVTKGQINRFLHAFPS